MKMLLNGALDSLRAGPGRDSSWSRWDALRRVRPYMFAQALGGCRGLGPFIEQTWKFHTVRDDKTILHYDAEVERNVLPELILLRCKNELRGLEKTFGFGLRRVNAFLFQNPQLIANAFGRECGGLALLSFNAIVVGDHVSVHEDIRHELIHLFAAKWNCCAPSLLQEGLAVHLQARCHGYPFTMFVRRLGSRAEWPLRNLLSRRFFFEPTYRHACYMLAGSFTRFLIGEFGWDAYRRLYKGCRAHLVEWAFKQSLGVSFEEAEGRWRRAAV